MIYIDTNVIVYSYVNLGDQKQIISKELIEQLISDGDLLLSPLVIQELIFVLNKLRVNKNEVSEIVNFFTRYAPYDVSTELVMEAYELCFKTDQLRSINDAVHLKFTEKHGDKLITFDNDFNKFIPFTTIEIEILKAE